MYHVDNFNNGYMEGLQFELGCFYLFHTDGINSNYNQIGNCDSISSNLVEINKYGFLKIYPNPSTGILNIEFPKNKLVDYNFTIIDISGKLISKGEINSKFTRIDIKNLKAGKYILNIQNAENIISGFFILK